MAYALGKHPPSGGAVGASSPYYRNRSGSETVPNGMWKWKRSCVRAGCAIIAVLAAGCSAVETTSADRFTAGGELIALSGGQAGASNACFTCHGLDGLGNGAGAPRLAGLNMGYLDRQLEAYASGRRQHPLMEWVAGRLSSYDRQKVSAYYAGMAYQPRPVQPVPVHPLYVSGDPDRGLPACAACHGLLGQGIGPANPPLGGQPPAYLAEQIERWRLAKRRNDPGNVMLRISQLLTPAEARALSAYAAALPGDLPRPAPPAASPAGRRPDPRNDASAPLPRGPAPAPAGS